jgi:hypothetical protein
MQTSSVRTPTTRERNTTRQRTAAQSPFSDTCFQRPDQSVNMGYLQADTTRHQALQNWQVDYYGQDLLYYLEAFDDADRHT